MIPMKMKAENITLVKEIAKALVAPNVFRESHYRSINFQEGYHEFTCRFCGVYLGADYGGRKSEEHAVGCLVTRAEALLGELVVLPVVSVEVETDRDSFVKLAGIEVGG
jgi:hypothetical protein